MTARKSKAHKGKGIMAETWHLPDLRRPVSVRAMVKPDRVGTHLNVEEKAAMRLACAIHRAESNDRSIDASWVAQEKAEAFINARGLFAALDEAERLEKIADQPGVKGS